jgi:peptidyl-prolyl cis-trans isomerase C
MRYTLAALIVGCSTSIAGAQSAAPDASIARVGDRVVTAAELRDVVIEMRRTGEMPKVIEALTPDGQRRILQQLVDARLLAIGARDLALDQDPAVRRAVERAVDAALADQMIRREVEKLDLTDAGLQRYYDAHQDTFRVGQRVKVRQIVVQTDAEARQALAALQAGRDFGDLAAERNIDASKKQRGELGWIARGVMVRPFEDAAFSLRPDDTSAVVQTSFGFHILNVEEVDPGTLLPLQNVRDQVRQRAVNERIDALKQALAEKHPVTVDESTLKEAVRLQ